MAVTASARPNPPFRLTLRSSAIMVALVGLLLVYATDQILPGTSDRQAELRFWIAARATGVIALLFLSAQVVFGLLLSHPHNKTTWKLSKRVFPWHDHIWVFVTAFLLIHLVSIVADPKSGVDVPGAFIPGLSQYRSAPVALGTMALYAFLVTAVTARWTKLLPSGMWLKLHRLSLVVFIFSWMHGILAGTDSPTLEGAYVAMALAVTAAGAYRYWAAKRSRPTFSTARLEADA